MNTLVRNRSSDRSARISEFVEHTFHLRITNSGMVGDGLARFVS